MNQKYLNKLLQTEGRGLCHCIRYRSSIYLNLGPLVDTCYSAKAGDKTTAMVAITFLTKVCREGT